MSMLTLFVLAAALAARLDHRRCCRDGDQREIGHRSSGRWSRASDRRAPRSRCSRSPSSADAGDSPYPGECCARPRRRRANGMHS